MQQTQPPIPPSKRNRSPSLLFQCSDLILPWLTPQELATVSLTCTALRAISSSITLRRASDASRSLEPRPIPFHNSVDRHPYAFFIYTPSQIPPSSSRFSLRQSWGSGCSAQGPNSASEIGVETIRLVDESGEGAAGCDCETCGEEGGGCPCSEFGGFDGVVSECGLGCGCGLDCGNRVSQRGIEVRLKIVRDRRKGWSLYADQFIPKGRFVCEYAEGVRWTCLGAVHELVSLPRSSAPTGIYLAAIVAANWSRAPSHCIHLSLHRLVYHQHRHTAPNLCDSLISFLRLLATPCTSTLLSKSRACISLLGSICFYLHQSVSTSVAL